MGASGDRRHYALRSIGLHWFAIVRADAWIHQQGKT